MTSEKLPTNRLQRAALCTAVEPEPNLRTGFWQRTHAVFKPSTARPLRMRAPPAYPRFHFFLLW
jgi:hypothetical protein